MPINNDSSNSIIANELVTQHPIVVYVHKQMLKYYDTQFQYWQKHQGLSKVNPLFVATKGPQMMQEDINNVTNDLLQMVDKIMATLNLHPKDFWNEFMYDLFDYDKQITTRIDHGYTKIVEEDDAYQAFKQWQPNEDSMKSLPYELTDMIVGLMEIEEKIRKDYEYAKSNQS